MIKRTYSHCFLLKDFGEKTNMKENSIFQEPQTEGMVFVSRFWKKYIFAHVKEISIFQVQMTKFKV